MNSSDLNDAWKNASEEMYKAQAESAQKDGGASSESNPKSNSKPNSSSGGDDVQDVDFEEVK